MNRTIKRLALPLGAAVVLGTAGFGYMASNTLAVTPNNGEVVTSVSGDTISSFGSTTCAETGGYHAANAVPTDTCGVSFYAAPKQAGANAPTNAVVSALDSSGNVIATAICFGGPIPNNPNSDFKCPFNPDTVGHPGNSQYYPAGINTKSIAKYDIVTHD